VRIEVSRSSSKYILCISNNGACGMWRSQACWLRSTETSFAHFYSIHVFSCSSKKVAHKLTRVTIKHFRSFQDMVYVYVFGPRMPRTHKSGDGTSTFFPLHLWNLEWGGVAHVTCATQLVSEHYKRNKQGICWILYDSVHTLQRCQLALSHKAGLYIYITSLSIYIYSIIQYICIYIFKHISIFFLRWDK
jgi:hypothetical protein